MKTKETFRVFEPCKRQHRFIAGSRCEPDHDCTQVYLTQDQEGMELRVRCSCECHAGRIQGQMFAAPVIQSKQRSLF